MEKHHHPVAIGSHQPLEVGFKTSDAARVQVAETWSREGKRIECAWGIIEERMGSVTCGDEWLCVCERERKNKREKTHTSTALSEVFKAVDCEHCAEALETGGGGVRLSEVWRRLRSLAPPPII